MKRTCESLDLAGTSTSMHSPSNCPSQPFNQKSNHKHHLNCLSSHDSRRTGTVLASCKALLEWLLAPNGNTQLLVPQGCRTLRIANVICWDVMPSLWLRNFWIQCHMLRYQCIKSPACAKCFLVLVCRSHAFLQPVDFGRFGLWLSRLPWHHTARRHCCEEVTQAAQRKVKNFQEIIVAENAARLTSSRRISNTIRHCSRPVDLLGIMFQQPQSPSLSLAEGETEKNALLQDRSGCSSPEAVPVTAIEISKRFRLAPVLKPTTSSLSWRSRYTNVLSAFWIHSCTSCEPSQLPPSTPAKMNEGVFEVSARPIDLLTRTECKEFQNRVQFYL